MTKDILVVDDEPDIRRLIVMHLERDGFRCRTAGTGPDALREAKAAAPDLVIQGTVSLVNPPVADLVISMTHSGTFTQADMGDTYTITVTNTGAAITAGTVSVADTLPSGLMATALGGTGWSATPAPARG